MPGGGAQRAFDEARFGATRILDVRTPMLRGDEAVRRAEGWLRAKQVEGAREVLVITGRGRGSVDGVAVVRTAVERLLARLAAVGVVAASAPHTEGSFVVQLAPLRAMLEGRRRRAAPAAGPTAPAGVPGLAPETRALLRALAERSLEALGVVNAPAPLVEAEMARHFSALARAAGPAPTEGALRAALERALRAVEDGER